MFTVIIPTMWKYPPFFDFLQDIVDVPLVGQVIIIDNDIDARPIAVHKVLENSKVDVICFDKNVYVNPAWNAGVKIAKYDRICLYGDDLIFDLRLFRKILPYITPENGVFGFCPGDESMGQPLVTDGSIQFTPAKNPYHYRDNFGYGMLMFLHKSNWVDVPEEIQLYWGDNFVFDTQYYMLNKNFFITNVFHHTPFAATTSKLGNCNEILAEENEAYNRIMPPLLRTIKERNAYRTGFGVQQSTPIDPELLRNLNSETKRHDVINYLIDKYNLFDYLEIGVFTGENFRRVNAKNKDGVDPGFEFGVPSEVNYPITSDEFFAAVDVDKKYDLIFIDGLHHSDQVDKDIRNSMKHLRENGFVVLHDCNPHSYESQIIPRQTGAWNGDVWKAFVDFRLSNPDYQTCTIDSDFGIGVIKNNPNVKYKIDGYRFRLTWEQFVSNRNQMLNLVSWEQFKTIF